MCGSIVEPYQYFMMYGLLGGFRNSDRAKNDTEYALRLLNHDVSLEQQKIDEDTVYICKSIISRPLRLHCYGASVTWM